MIDMIMMPKETMSQEMRGHLENHLEIPVTSKIPVTRGNIPPKLRLDRRKGSYKRTPLMKKRRTVMTAILVTLVSVTG